MFVYFSLFIDSLFFARFSLVVCMHLMSKWLNNKISYLFNSKRKTSHIINSSKILFIFINHTTNLFFFHFFLPLHALHHTDRWLTQCPCFISVAQKLKSCTNTVSISTWARSIRCRSVQNLEPIASSNIACRRGITVNYILSPMYEQFSSLCTHKRNNHEVRRWDNKSSCSTLVYVSHSFYSKVVSVDYCQQRKILPQIHWLPSMPEPIQHSKCSSRNKNICWNKRTHIKLDHQHDRRIFYTPSVYWIASNRRKSKSHYPKVMWL